MSGLCVGADNISKRPADIDPDQLHRTSSRAQAALHQGSCCRCRLLLTSLSRSPALVKGDHSSRGIVNEIFLQVNNTPCPTTPRCGFPLHCWLDILVVAEQIRWIVFLLQLRQTLVVGAVGRPDLVGAVFFLAPDMVEVDSTSSVGLQGLP